VQNEKQKAETKQGNEPGRSEYTEQGFEEDY